MTDEVVVAKVRESTGVVAYGMLLLGNALLIFFLITIGIGNQNVFADLIWCVVLDICVVYIIIKYDLPARRKK